MSQYANQWSHSQSPGGVEHRQPRPPMSHHSSHSSNAIGSPRSSPGGGPPPPGRRLSMSTHGNGNEYPFPGHPGWEQNRSDTPTPRRYSTASNGHAEGYFLPNTPNPMSPPPGYSVAQLGHPSQQQKQQMFQQQHMQHQQRMTNAPSQQIAFNAYKMYGQIDHQHANTHSPMGHPAQQSPQPSLQMSPDDRNQSNFAAYRATHASKFSNSIKPQQTKGRSSSQVSRPPVSSPHASFRQLPRHSPHMSLGGSPAPQYQQGMMMNQPQQSQRRLSVARKTVPGLPSTRGFPNSDNPEVIVDEVKETLQGWEHSDRSMQLNADWHRPSEEEVAAQRNSTFNFETYPRQHHEAELLSFIDQSTQLPTYQQSLEPASSPSVSFGQPMSPPNGMGRGLPLQGPSKVPPGFLKSGRLPDILAYDADNATGRSSFPAMSPPMRRQSFANQVPGGPPRLDTRFPAGRLMNKQGEFDIESAVTPISPFDGRSTESPVDTQAPGDLRPNKQSQLNNQRGTQVISRSASRKGRTPSTSSRDLQNVQNDGSLEMANENSKMVNATSEEALPQSSDFRQARESFNNIPDSDPFVASSPLLSRSKLQEQLTLESESSTNAGTEAILTPKAFPQTSSSAAIARPRKNVNQTPQLQTSERFTTAKDTAKLDDASSDSSQTPKASAQTVSSASQKKPRGKLSQTPHQQTLNKRTTPGGPESLDKKGSEASHTPKASTQTISQTKAPIKSSQEPLPKASKQLNTPVGSSTGEEASSEATPTPKASLQTKPSAVSTQRPRKIVSQPATRADSEGATDTAEQNSEVNRNPSSSMMATPSSDLPTKQTKRKWVEMAQPKASLQGSSSSLQHETDQEVQADAPDLNDYSTLHDDVRDGLNALESYAPMGKFNSVFGDDESFFTAAAPQSWMDTDNSEDIDFVLSGIPVPMPSPSLAPVRAPFMAQPLLHQRYQDGLSGETEMDEEAIRLARVAFNLSAHQTLRASLSASQAANSGLRLTTPAEFKHLALASVRHETEDWQNSEDGCYWCQYEVDYGLSDDNCKLPKEAFGSICGKCYAANHTFRDEWKVSDKRQRSLDDPDIIARINELEKEPTINPLKEAIFSPDSKAIAASHFMAKVLPQNTISIIDGKDISKFRGILTCRSSSYGQIDVSKVRICGGCRAEKYQIIKHGKHMEFTKIIDEQPVIARRPHSRRCMMCNSLATDKCPGCPLRLCDQCEVVLRVQCEFAQGAGAIEC